MIKWVIYEVLTKITLGIQHGFSTPSAAPLYSAAEVSP